MKILHTSDWHLGHLLYNYDRREEQESMLQQMVDIVNDELPDLFILCGDVYHTSQPSATVQTMFTEAMVRIAATNPDMVTVVTAGNHDSGAKHDIFRTPWRALKVFTIGNIERETPENHIVELPNKGYVIALPYSHERNIPEGYFQQLLDNVTERNTANLPVIMTAHTTVRGCDYSGHEGATEHSVGGIDTYDLKDMGEGYDYLALGHIHRPQFIHSGKHNVRYSGTPLPVSFDETFDHSVSIVEIDAHGEKPKVRTIEINNPHPLVTLPTEGMTSWEEAKNLLKNYPNDIAAYIRLNVEIEDFLPTEAFAEAEDLTIGKQCRFCHINARRKMEGKREERMLTVQEFQQEAPIDIARRYADDIGINFDEELISMFNETQRMLNNE